MRRLTKTALIVRAVSPRVVLSWFYKGFCTSGVWPVRRVSPRSTPFGANSGAQGFVPGVPRQSPDRPANLDHLAGKISVAPMQRQHLAQAHAGEKSNHTLSR